MADNYLERQRADYEERKKQWLLKKRNLRSATRVIEKGEDEAL